jgi:catechol 2,3-dioxygenase-like lactoylglutathione lyase family enzyme
MKITLKTIGIVAKDMGKTLDFYRTLGLDIPHGLESEGNVDFETSEGLVLGFITEETTKHADPDYQTPNGHSMNLQFMVDSPTDVDAVYGKLTKAGYKGYAEPWDAFWGQRFARVMDPDGRVVNIYAHL